MTHLDRLRPSELKVMTKGQERIVIASFCGSNRSAQVAKYQRKVFEHFGFPLNQILVDFSKLYHGPAIDEFLKQIDSEYEHFVLFDTDAVPLKRNLLERLYEKIRDGRTLIGLAQQSNHIQVNGTTNHLYVGPGALAISRRMYVGLGRPSFAESWRSDTAEELTWRAEELGYTVALMFPSHVHQRLWDLGNGHFFGRGTTYNRCVFHCFLQNEPRSQKLFVTRCRSILTGRGRAKKTSRG